ncbi:MAG: TIGR03960 family B12-binding radical SAM protein [Syntrophobacterales bacterium]|nr:TIGR03960 family B12-binding radical SAM protein [Syntrophobacterales bacterium]
MNYSSIEELLPLVQKPGRYIGGEINSIKKDREKCSLTFALAFPDTYEIGMSHLGLQIFYSILNNEPEIAAERFYAPWPDMESLMRENGIPLASLESSTPLSGFDIVGFSLQYELSYTNVLNMLDLGSVPIYSRDRKEDAPIIIAGGPSVFNPGPVMPFFDAFVIGEGEEVILEISRAMISGKEKKTERAGLLNLLAEIDGVWVPPLHGMEKKITKRVVADLEKWRSPSKPIVPLVKTVHDRTTMEIARGCTRGCRFCQPGMVWRPVRERSIGALEKMAEKMLSSTGHNEISLLSLSSGDYSHIEQLLTSLMNQYYEKRVALALPSMRVETLTEKLIEQIKRVRKTSFTLAPEAGTQRLRDVINKGNTEEALLATVRKVFDAGWKSIKLYFMIGLPSETQEDLEGIVDLAYKVLREGGNRRQVTVSISTFIPKPFTPFQWQRQITIDETKEKQDFLKKNIRHKNLKLKWHDREMSFLEGLITRGDEKISNLVAKAFHSGCRFDGWSDRFQFDIWKGAIDDLGIKTDDYLGERNMEDSLPWDNIDCGITKEFLAEEYEKSLNAELTEDCRSAGCYQCGACSGNIRIIEAGKPHTTPSRESVPFPREAEITRLRIRFAKQGKAGMLSHLELSSSIVRAINISGFVFTFSEGFHPHPKISFPYALPVGVESLCEYVDIQLREYSGSPKDFTTGVNSCLPSGIEILSAEMIFPHTISLSNLIEGFDYEIHLPPAPISFNDSAPDEKIKTFLKSDTFMIPRYKKGAIVTKDIRPLVDSIALDTKKAVISMSVRFDPGGGIKPLEILTQVAGFDDEYAKRARIIKTGIKRRE